MKVIMENEIFFFTVGELKKILEEYPNDMPVVVSGYENGYENFYHPIVQKVIHLPENTFREGQFQLNNKGREVLIIEREFRDD
mgnify:CR=1 FL=1